MSRVALTVQGAELPHGTSDDLTATLEGAMDSLGVQAYAQVSLVLSTDEELHRLNLAYRGIDGPTDVLSFPFDAGHVPPEESVAYLGDILISVPYARRSAAAQDRPLDAELCLLAVHGLLHLLGHEDETDDGAERMRQAEVSLGVRKD